MQGSTVENLYFLSRKGIFESAQNPFRRFTHFKITVDEIFSPERISQK